MYYLELDFNKKILTDDYVHPFTGNLSAKYWHVESKFIHSETQDLFFKFGFELYDVEMFWKRPGVVGVAHHDVVYNNETETWDTWDCAININLTNAESIMYWLSSTLHQISPPNKKAKLNGIHYGKMQNTEFRNAANFTILDRLMLTKPTLVRTSVIHAVENTDNKDRWCVSLRFKGNPTFEECANRLKSLTNN
jgi:hypothetical protein